MGKSRHMWVPDSRSVSCRKGKQISVSLLIIAFLLPVCLLCGCSQSQTAETFRLSSLEQDFELTPCKKPDGTPFRLAVIDEGPPIESSFLWLKGLCEELQKLGWISQELDLESSPHNFKGYYSRLLDGKTGDFLVFDDTPYFVYGTEEDAALGELLRERVQAGQIDAIAVTGTLPGVFMKNLELGIPFLVSFATDPVASGIIASAEGQGRGEENIWALVEPEPLERQLTVYQQLLQMNQLVILASAEDADIAGVSVYEEAAQHLNLPYQVLKFSQSERSNESFQIKLLNQARELIEGGADAFLVTYGALDTDQIEYLTRRLAYRGYSGIACLVSDGNDLVEHGGLVCMSCYDYENYGHYTAQILSNIFHGQKAGDQPRVYTSSMRIVLNLTTAKDSGLLTDFAFLQSVDTVYR